jgi:hypothetical protein
MQSSWDVPGAARYPDLSFNWTLCLDHLHTAEVPQRARSQQTSAVGQKFRPHSGAKQSSTEAAKGADTHAASVAKKTSRASRQ